jgi:hypothetical protein
LSPVHHIPVVDDRGLLVTLVPHGAHDEKGRLTHGFEYSKQRSACDESWETETK